MEELPLIEAFFAGQTIAMRNGLWFVPNTTKLMNDLYGTEKKAGTIILPNGEKNYKIINIEVHQVQNPRVENDFTAEELWECVKEHYGLNILTGITSMGAIPIPKPWLGHFVTKGASGFTNPISEFGTRFYPLKNLRHGTKFARSAKAVFGTTRIFGLIGRANIVSFVGFAIFDVISLSVCMNKK